MEIPTHWRLKAQRYRLEGSICPTCGRITFPPRPVCPSGKGRAVRASRDLQLSPFVTPAKEILLVKG